MSVKQDTPIDALIAYYKEKGYDIEENISKYWLVCFSNKFKYIIVLSNCNIMFCDRKGVHLVSTHNLSDPNIIDLMYDWLK